VGYGFGRLAALPTMHLVGFARRSEMTKIKRLPALLAGIGLKMSTDRSVKGTVAGKNVNGNVCHRNDRRFCAHVVHLVMVLWISVAIDGQ